MFIRSVFLVFFCVMSFTVCMEDTVGMNSEANQLNVLNLPVTVQSKIVYYLESYRFEKEMRKKDSTKPDTFRLSREKPFDKFIIHDDCNLSDEQLLAYINEGCHFFEWYLGMPGTFFGIWSRCYAGLGDWYCFVNHYQVYLKHKDELETSKRKLLYSAQLPPQTEANRNFRWRDRIDCVDCNKDRTLLGVKLAKHGGEEQSQIKIFDLRKDNKEWIEENALQLFFAKISVCNSREVIKIKFQKD